VPTYIYETTVRAITAGTLPLFAQAFTTGNRFSGPVVISGNAVIPTGAPQYMLVESDPIDLQVKPLPRRGELPGFTGAVGNFSVDPPKLSTNFVQVGEPVRLSVIVRSAGDSGNLTRLVPPPAPKLDEWQVLAATPEGLPPQIIEAQGFTGFHFTLVPLSEKASATPSIPFSYFDPSRAVYADLTIPSVPITVSTGAAPADLQVLLEPTPAPEEEEKLVLSGLAAGPGRTARSLTPWQQQPWFPLVQLAPAFFFAALWGWDRRRRYLEQHPDIIIRRRARRGLRRQRSAARKAALAGDGAGFAAAAVHALQIGCAPHFPAEPRALVGTDVLQVLHQGNGNGSQRADELVRRFFSANDVTRFGTSRAETSALLSLQPELEGLLEQLEARL
jgi:hypothetical protein